MGRVRPIMQVLFKPGTHLLLSAVACALIRCKASPSDAEDSCSAGDQCELNRHGLARYRVDQVHPRTLPSGHAWTAPCCQEFSASTALAGAAKRSACNSSRCGTSILVGGTVHGIIKRPEQVQHAPSKASMLNRKGRNASGFRCCIALTTRGPQGGHPASYVIERCAQLDFQV